MVENIESFPQLAAGVPWFVALPDCDGGPAVAARLNGLAPRSLAHGSGRPWLLGSWPDGEATFAQAGRVRLALLGHHAISAPRLQDIARRAGSFDELERLTSTLDGSFHLVAGIDGTVRIRGPILGLRPVFRARTEGICAASDRADVLAALSGAGIDEQRLALRLLLPPVLHPVTDQPVWHGVEAVQPDHWLVLDRSGRDRTLRHWTPPEPVLSRAAGAAALREALSSAVAARVDGGGQLSCDLAGLDSTALCALAGRQDARVLAITAENPDPRDDDVQWAQRTVSGLPTVDHEVIAVGDMPLFYANLLATTDRFDEPCWTEMDLARFSTLIGRAAHERSRLHLNGFGGDEALQGALNHLHGMIRTNPRVAFGHVRGLRARYRWSRREVLRQLLRDRPYRAWLAETAEHLTAATPRMQTPLLGWSWPPRFPPWVTPAALDAARDLIRAAVDTAQPLAATRGLHFDLEAMRSGARGARQYDQIARRIGVPTSSPFYDDKVVTAALAVRPEHRLSPWEYKPLIVEAMRGIVPAASLQRVTKADWSVAHEKGLRTNRDQLMALADDSRLERLGMIDVDRFRAICSRPLPRHLHPGVFDPTAGCERWLRSLDATTTPAERRSHEHQAA